MKGSVMNIEKGVSVPPANRSGDYKYPIREMNIGDSILDSGAEKTSSSKIRLSAKKYGDKVGKKFIARKVSGGVRIWRVE